MINERLNIQAEARSNRKEFRRRSDDNRRMHGNGKDEAGLVRSNLNKSV